MERARILVADDKENILKLVTRILGDTYDVTTAGDGGRAISLIGGQEFDIVLTDLRMPGADGFEVLRRRELEGVYSFHNLVGKSAPMKDVYHLLDQASKLDITVLLNGETRTGKELAACTGCSSGTGCARTTSSGAEHPR